ncbi:MAG: PTS system nitrogen regulatory IIA component [Halothiobacillaceae bacterium]|nr:MAG: PTS system nitrogen regulatory IIA component [Halothiobacillaceae bacterium]
MNAGELLSPDRVACGVRLASKKRVLEMASQLLAASVENLSQGEVFDSLLARERLGSTGLGWL